MTHEVLLAVLLCIAGFSSGRLQVSSKEANQKVGEALLVASAICFVSYISVYGNWPWSGPAVLLSYGAGIFGKDSLKFPLRRTVRPEMRRVVGPWKQIQTTKNEDDHSDTGIG